MMTKRTQRRAFLAATGGIGAGAMLGDLQPLTAQDVQLPGGVARFSAELEPLVRVLEETPREKLIEQMAQRVKDGLSYREVLAALMLAGVRNIQPRPSVGFKFHAVLVVNSAHLASISCPDSDRWLPIFWAIDNFKSSQARDVKEGDWTLPAVDESRLPGAHRAVAELTDALDRWDEAKADVAVTSLVRHGSANQAFDLLANYAARDYRSIGHKVIFLSNAFRTLGTIGWEFAEPVLRSLVYAMLNHVGDPNPADSDLAADRPGRVNRKRVLDIKPTTDGSISSEATVELLQTIRQGTADEASANVVQLLNSGISVQSIWDALFASASELMMRQKGIVSLHAVTTSNAIHYAYQTTASLEARKFLLLQNASFLTMFRESARSRGALADRPIEKLAASESGSDSPDGVRELFQSMGVSRSQAASQVFGYLQSGGDSQRFIDHARRLIFLKGSDSHDYKFSSAALEDYRSMSPTWRDRYLAACAYQLRTEAEPTRGLVRRIQQAFAG